MHVSCCYLICIVTKDRFILAFGNFILNFLKEKLGSLESTLPGLEIGFFLNFFNFMLAKTVRSFLSLDTLIRVKNTASYNSSVLLDSSV
jgi:hypothetical protein